MDRNEKLLLSASEAYGHTFRHGVFMRLYEQSLFWFSVHIKPLKPMLERVKGGEPVVYGGLPITSFEALLEQGLILAPETTEYGFRWAYAQQTPGNTEDFTGFAEWRERAAATTAPVVFMEERNILAEILHFNLAVSTPIQAMNAIHDWQSFLLRQEGTG